MIPKVLEKLITDFEKLPGVGPKTAARFAFYVMRMPLHEVEIFSNDLLKMKKDLKYCDICKNISGDSTCSTCMDTHRDSYVIAVVSSPMDALSMEKTGFKGVYHVLHGVIDPLNGVGPEQLFVYDILNRIKTLKQSEDKTLEFILATGTGLEGEATSSFISKMIRNAGYTKESIKITRIARGLPVGGDVEYADEITLMKALDGRVEY